MIGNLAGFSLRHKTAIPPVTAKAKREGCLTIPRPDAHCPPLEAHPMVKQVAIAVVACACACGGSSDAIFAPRSGSELNLLLADPPPGHAYVFSEGSGSELIAEGPSTSTSTAIPCGTNVLEQRLKLLSPPCNQGSCGPVQSWTTRAIPPGRYSVSAVGYCSPYYIYDVNLSP